MFCFFFVLKGKIRLFLLIKIKFKCSFIRV